MAELVVHLTDCDPSHALQAVTDVGIRHGHSDLLEVVAHAMVRIRRAPLGPSIDLDEMDLRDRIVIGDQSEMGRH